MGTKSKTLQVITGNAALRGGFATETLAATRTLTAKDAQFQALDPGGAGRTVVLPDVETSGYDGYFFVIANTADAAEALTITDASANTISAPGQNEAAIVYVTSAGQWAAFRIFSTST